MSARKQLPHGNYLFFAKNAALPYGNGLFSVKDGHYQMVMPRPTHSLPNYQTVMASSGIYKAFIL
ncbi:hypothetical protein [Carboxylicivirga sp. N1Y90]|uniref:hypothetical protein n=1 Tax=Carboxylicivirga fragile TaxID=3417571 RepID=UPI003D33A99D|nr:hypothetical protein [Marinilabiliaceae bacterium N1Y90]